MLLSNKWFVILAYISAQPYWLTKKITSSIWSLASRYSQFHISNNILLTDIKYSVPGTGELSFSIVYQVVSLRFNKKVVSNRTKKQKSKHPLFQNQSKQTEQLFNYQKKRSQALIRLYIPSCTITFSKFLCLVYWQRPHMLLDIGCYPYLSARWKQITFNSVGSKQSLPVHFPITTCSF